MAPIQTLVNFPIRKSIRRKAKNENGAPKLTQSCRKNRRFKDEGNDENAAVGSSKESERCDGAAPVLLETPKRKKVGWENKGLTSPAKKTKPSSESDSPIVKRKTFKPLQLFKQDVSLYQQAKLALHTSTPSHLIGREGECSKLAAFLNRNLDERKAGCIYLSGAPGTGKTACLVHLLDNIGNGESYVSVFLNCMTVRQSSTIFEKIGTDLGCEGYKNQRDLLNCIEKKLTQKGPMVILSLDELDHLSSKNQDVLYTVFEWPRLPQSRLILIGIANSLDLTDRVLPRLHACGCDPELLHFAPYSREQILAILSDRLKEFGQKEQPSCVIKPTAVQLCARKIAACTGDIRKALETCRRALEIVEREAKSQSVLKSTSDDGCNPGSPRKSPRKVNPVPKQVDVPQIMSVLHEIYGSRIIASGAAASSTLNDSLPTQQKLFLCSLQLLTRCGKTRDVLFGKLHETYSRVCKKHQIGQVDPSELLCICSLIEARGLIHVKRNKEARLSKIQLKVDEDEMLFVMKDKALLATVLNDISVLK